MHDSLIMIVVLLLVALAAALLTVCVLKRIRRGSEDMHSEEVRKQAETLRQSAEQMNRSSSNIQLRARRLEQLLAAQKSRSRDE